MTRTMVTAGCLALLSAFPVGAKNTDTILLMDGGEERGVTVTRENVDEVRVRGASKASFRAKDVLRIVHGSPPRNYARGESALLAGRYDAAEAAFASAESEEGDWVKPYAIYNRAEALRRWGAAADDSSKLSAATDLYRRFLSEHAEHFLTAPVLYGLGEALRKDGDVSGARAEFEKVADRKYGDYWEQWGKLGVGLCALSESSYTDALTQFVQVSGTAKERPGFSELFARAMVAEGETYLGKKDFDRAIGFYEDLARSGGGGAQSVAGAYVNLAKAYEQRGKTGDDDRALRMFMSVTIYYAGAPEAYAEALYRTGEMLEKRGKKEQAEAFFRELKARAPGSSWADKR